MDTALMKVIVFTALLMVATPALAQPISTNDLPPELQALTQSYTEMSSQMIYWRTQAIAQKAQIAALQRELDASKKNVGPKVDSNPHKP